MGTDAGQILFSQAGQLGLLLGTSILALMAVSPLIDKFVPPKAPSPLPDGVENLDRWQ